VPELQFAPGVLERLQATGRGQFDERAYLFVLAAIEFLQQKLDARRHVSGQELSWACRDLALQRFGVMARTVLDCWGVRTTADFGAIVYSLIDIGLLSSQPSDTEADFDGVFDFEAALDRSHQFGIPRTLQ